MNRVFVQDSHGRPLMPCHPARARQLRKAGRARVVRYRPFTIKMLDRTEGEVQPVRLKLDPGSKVTGIALVAAFRRRGHAVVWAGELGHRGDAVRKKLADRRALRRGRRGRQCRNRPPRFLNRRRQAGWLPPSLRSRVDNGRGWAKRLILLAPVSAIDVETARFDVHAMSAGRDLEGVEYQQGTLQDWELREYLLYRHKHTCAYCQGQTKDNILEREHVVPRSRGGSNRVGNQVLACRSCNVAKGAQTAEEWAGSLKGQRSKLARTRRESAQKVAAGQRPSLRDAAALNATRYALGRELKAFGLPVVFWSGGRTKANRSGQGYPKAHWIDAACVGETGDCVGLDPCAPILTIKAIGRGHRQVQGNDKYGFPNRKPRRAKRVNGFQTGDLALLIQPKGQHAGVHVGRVTVRADGRFWMRAGNTKIEANWKRFRLLQRADGYSYKEAQAA